MSSTPDRDDDTWEITPRPELPCETQKKKKRSTQSINKDGYGSFYQKSDREEGEEEVQRLLASLKFRVEYLEKEVDDQKSRSGCCCTQNCTIM